ncbi:hypothetical protein VKT23_018686 [Stygiomarasmius scandens]
MVNAASTTTGAGEDNRPPARRSSRSRSPGDRGRDSESSNPGTNLHVSGLSYKVDNRDLENVFAKVGRVAKASVVFDPHTRESRQFGFVMMETAEEADAAITALNGTELMGRTIAVTKARRARARTPTPGKYHGVSKKRDHDNHRPYDPRPYDSRYSRDRGYDSYSSRDRDYGYDRSGDRRDRDYDRRDRDRGKRGDRYRDDRDRYDRY